MQESRNRRVFLAHGVLNLNAPSVYRKFDASRQSVFCEEPIALYSVEELMHF